MIIFLLVPESLETRYCLASLLENSDTSPFQGSTHVPTSLATVILLISVSRHFKSPEVDPNVKTEFSRI